MRRQDKEIPRREELDTIIRDCEVCRLAFAVCDEPYLVPVCFGYNGLHIYFHTAKTGKKIDCIEANNRVCFEMERNVSLVEDEVKPCKWSFAFESIVGFGTIQEVLTPEDKAKGMQVIMKHYSGREWEIPKPGIEGVRVWRLTVSSATGKRSERKTG